MHNMSENTQKKQNLTFDDLPELMTLEEVSKILRVSKITLKRWGKKGKLPAIRINSRGDRRYKRVEVMRFLGMQTEL
jgi:excisionase family DNA binding protein